MESRENLQRRMDAIWEKIAEADLTKAQATVKALKARRAAEKAEKEEWEARTASQKLWDDWTAVREALDSLRFEGAAS